MFSSLKDFVFKGESGKRGRNGLAGPAGPSGSPGKEVTFIHHPLCLLRDIETWLGREAEALVSGLSVLLSFHWDGRASRTCKIKLFVFFVFFSSYRGFLGHLGPKATR